MGRTDVGESFKLILGTLFGSGYLPKAPGTWGSLFSLPFVYAAWLAGGISGLMLLTILTCALSLWTAPTAIRRLGDDPGEFVMDECAGVALLFFIAATFGIEPAPLSLLLGFLLFRLFDITKPLGITRVEKFRGKYGILVDDLLAGFYASLSLIAIFYLISLI